VGHISNAQFLTAYAVATVVGITVFLHADRHGSRHSTAWGISVFLFLGVALPVYVIHVFRARGSKRRW